MVAGGDAIEVVDLESGEVEFAVEVLDGGAWGKVPLGGDLNEGDVVVAGDVQSEGFVERLRHNKVVRRRGSFSLTGIGKPLVPVRLEKV
ncbi:MAG: hypothetical protein HY820_03740 [Acidobacteria bacterium]|nr:hypothetical protein [Acidobacteriota bacterium]